MIFNCYIFNRSGKRIFYREYNRTYNAFEKSPEEESKLICGFLLSINAILEKFSHEKEKENGLHCFQTKSYKFHYLEVPSGLKLIINTDLSVIDMQEILWKLYSLFTELVVQNPNWSVEDEIDMPDFVNAVDKLLN